MFLFLNDYVYFDYIFKLYSLKKNVLETLI